MPDTTSHWEGQHTTTIPHTTTQTAQHNTMRRVSCDPHNTIRYAYIIYMYVHVGICDGLGRTHVGRDGYYASYIKMIHICIHIYVCLIMYVDKLSLKMHTIYIHIYIYTPMYMKCLLETYRWWGCRIRTRVQAESARCREGYPTALYHTHTYRYKAHTHSLLEPHIHGWGVSDIYRERMVAALYVILVFSNSNSVFQSMDVPGTRSHVV